MTQGSEPSYGSIHEKKASSLSRHRQIVNSEIEPLQTTAKAESFPQPLEPSRIEVSSTGRKEIQGDTCSEILDDVAGVSSNFGKLKDKPSTDVDPQQKIDLPRVYMRNAESPALYGQGHHLNDKLNAESKSSSGKHEQTAEDDEKYKSMIEKVDKVHRVEDGETTLEVRFNEPKLSWNPVLNIPMVVLDADGKPQALSIIVDTGSESSLISDEAVRMLKLRKRPIQASDDRHPQRKIETHSYVALGGVSITPTHFVILRVKGHKIGLDDFVESHIRVETENGQIPPPTDVIFGMPFIVRNNVLQKLLAMPRDRNPFLVLRKGKQSKTQKTEDQRLKEEDRALAERLNRTKSSDTASLTAAVSTATRDRSDNSMGSWNHSRDWQSQDSSNTSLTRASGAGKHEAEDVSSH